MDSNTPFLGLPPYIWKGLFEMAKILIAGIVLGIFASRYQKRKEVEIQIKGKILTHRIENLEKVEKVVGELFHKISPSLKDETLYQHIINGMNFPIREMEYAIIFDNEKNFDAYYQRINAVVMEAHSYMTLRMEKTLSEFIQYLTELKLMMDAFGDTERCIDWGYSANEVSNNMDNAYRLAGTVLQSDIDRFYCIVDNEVARQMKHISLKYGYNRFWKKLWDIKQNVLESLEKYLDNKGWRGYVSKKIYYGYINRNYGNSCLINSADTFVVMLMFVHYSSRYSRDQFDDLPKEQKNNLITIFRDAYYPNYHV
jgi:hypothetical protein